VDLAKHIDPEVAAVLPGLPVLDLTDIPAARQALLERRAVASAGLEPSPTELHVYPGGIHAFDSYAAASALARRFAGDRDDALRRAFAA
jgi:hypothetical protein